MADGSSFDQAFYERTGPSLLAEQPVSDTPAPKKLTDDWTIVFERLESRLGQLRNWRYSWWAYWSRLAELFVPFRYTFLVVANKTWRGQPLNDAIIDSTGLQAVRTCAAGLHSGLTNPSRPWFTLDIGLPWIELDAEGKEWLEDTQEKAYTVLAQSNFYQTMAQAFTDVTTFGTAPMIMYEDFEDVIRCYLPCAGEYFLGAGARLSIDTLYREFTLTIAQIVEMFGIANCPQQVSKLWMEGGSAIDTEFVVAHSIEPNFGFQDRSGGPEIKLVPGMFTFREVYWLKGQKTDAALSVRGFRNAPFMAARWATVSNDAYGRSPCMDALGDNRQVQRETERKAEFIEKGVRPPMGANPELKNEPSSIIPGMVTYMNTEGGKKGFFPLFEMNPAWLAALTADIDKVNARIEKCLFVDLFMAITRMEGVQPRNELELTQRNMERLQELGPFIQMFENEFAGPAIRRLLDIMMHRKLLKPLPRSLQSVPIKINYVSIMKLAQNASESLSMKDVLNFGGLAASAAQSAGQPNPLRTMDMDKLFREYGEKNNAPQNIWYTDDQVAQSDKAKAKAAAMAQAPAAAMAAVTAAKTLAETPIQPGNALSALGGQGGAPI